MPRHGPIAENDNHDHMRNVICGSGNVDHLASNPNITEAEELKLSFPLRMLGSNLYSMRQYAEEQSAVYVISDIFGVNVKIGEAKDINKRLTQLQSGNPRRLYVRRAFWFRNKQYAQYVENLTHHALPAKGYRRLQSEWFSCSPFAAHNLILSTVDTFRIPQFGVATPGTEHWRQDEAA